jgi:hypothetical protein
MKRAMFSAMTLIVLVGLTGCATQRGLHPQTSSCGSCAATAEGGQSCDASCSNGCATDPDQCAYDPGGGSWLSKLCGKCRLRKERAEQPMVDPGPAAGAVTYPYYTTRGPRDYLARNPQSIGP